VIGTGHRNTAVVVAAGATETLTSAIAFSDQYVAPNGTSDWFLPSKDEMATLVANASAASVSLIFTSSYWTSSQSTVAANQVWEVQSTTGRLLDYYKNRDNYLAPIRAG
jgi:hypothetical protein